jgi:hypothetical protein
VAAHTRTEEILRDTRDGESAITKVGDSLGVDVDPTHAEA